MNFTLIGDLVFFGGFLAAFLNSLFIFKTGYYRSTFQRDAVYEGAKAVTIGVIYLMIAAAFLIVFIARVG